MKLYRPPWVRFGRGLPNPSGRTGQFEAVRAYGPELLTTWNGDDPTDGLTLATAVVAVSADVPLGSSDAKSLDITPEAPATAGTVIVDTPGSIAVGDTFRAQVWLKVLQGNVGIAVHSWTYGQLWASELFIAPANWTLWSAQFVCNEAGRVHFHISSIGVAGTAHALYSRPSVKKILNP